MADPAESALGYLSGFDSLDALWAAHADGRHKFHGILDRIPGYRRWSRRGPGLTVDNAAAAFVDQPIAEGLGDETALVTAARRVTYAELSALVDRAGHALRARGVEPEQRVALLLPDGVGFAAAFFAAIKIGAVAVPLNTRLASAEPARRSSRTAAPRCWSRTRTRRARGGLEGLVADAPTRC